jgi:hypothetical protein
MRKTQYVKAEDWVTIAEILARKNGGILPNPQALIKKEDFGWALYQQMRRHPGLFEHIEQERKIQPKETKPTRRQNKRHVCV